MGVKRSISDQSFAFSNIGFFRNLIFTLLETPPPLDSQNFPSSNSHVKFKNFWWKLDQDLELILFKDLSSQLSSKVLNQFFSKILVLNCCRNFCSNNLNWFLNQFWSKFWSKGSLKNLIKNKFKILNQFFLKLLVLNSDQSSVQKFWRISSCPQFWSKSWIDLSSQLFSKFAEMTWISSDQSSELIQFSTLIKILFKLWFKVFRKVLEEWIESVLAPILIKVLIKILNWFQFSIVSKIC